jgi:tetratricopeptide (TPR) repeat protein
LHLEFLHLDHPKKETIDMRLTKCSWILAFACVSLSSGAARGDEPESKKDEFSNRFRTYVRSAAREADVGGNPQEQLQALIDVAETQRLMSDDLEAGKTLDLAIAAASKRKDDRKCAEGLLNCARVAAALGKKKEAADLLSRAIDQAKTIGDDEFAGDSKAIGLILEIAREQASLGEREQAKKTLHMIGSKLEGLEPDADLLNSGRVQLAWTQIQANFVAEAIQTLDQVWKLSKNDALHIFALGNGLVTMVRPGDASKNRAVLEWARRRNAELERDDADPNKRTSRKRRKDKSRSPPRRKRIRSSRRFSAAIASRS